MKRFNPKQIEQLLGVLDAAAAKFIETGVDNELLRQIEREKDELWFYLSGGNKKPPKYSIEIIKEEINQYLNDNYLIAKFGNKIIAMPSRVNDNGKRLTLKIFYRKET